ncbi:hypothetical protein [Hoylesella saccharolytica]|uniref:hypothetical protein n=1 Tax=Hoylesella saccharolytica TaxID=633701 RepID=UPI0028EE192A|nr:hypothetical protein [Hoylesella saccharolytica]
MKRNILKLACLAVAVLLVACSSEDMVGEGKKVDVSKGITFQFSEERFLPGTFSSTTRAAMQPQVVDLGNGMEAEMTLEPDSSCMGNTRAGDTPISDGHYMIYAIKTEDGQRYDGLKGEVKNGKFIPDTPTPWYLEPGKEYTFVCWKDKEEDNGTYYPSIVDNGTEIQVYAGCNAMIGTTVHTVTYDDEDVVPFVMRHLDARVRVQFNTYTAPMKNAEISGLSGDGTDNADRNFDLKGNLTYAGIGGPPQINGAFDITPAYTPSAKTIVYKHLSKNSLYYPDNSHIAILYFPINFTSTSTLYGKSLSDFTNTNPQRTGSAGGQNLSSTLQKNHSYTFKINIRPSVLYLFSDGTVGTLGDKGSRTPIAVVVKEKTSASDKGLAVALTPAGNSIIPWGYHGTNYFIAGGDGSFDNMKGYEYTYTTNYYNPAAFTEYGLPMATTPPAEQQNLLPTYYYAAHYNPGVPVTGANIGKWFLPSAGQVKLLLKRYADLKEADMPTDFYDFWSPPTPVPGAPINTTKLEKVFTDGGATLGNYHWALSGTDANNHSISVSMWGGKAAWNYESGNLPYMHQQDVYPFVYF